MVIRLGAGSERPNLAGAGYRRILQGQMLHLHTISDTAVSVRAWARVIYDGTGQQQLLTIPETARSGSRVAEDLASADIVIADGWIVNAEVEMLTDDIQRGQTYVRLSVEPFGASLLADYCFSDFGIVSLGTFGQPGPGGGDGDLRVVTVKVLAAPAAQTYFSPVLSNMVRKVKALSWYYEASSDADTRVLAIAQENFLGASTVGPAANTTDVWGALGLTLTADQDGMIFCEESRSGINDNGTLTISDVTTAPTPFPLLVSEDMSTILRFDFTVVDGHANDRDVIYALVEGWVVP